MSETLDGFDPISPESAVALLEKESGMGGELADMAALLDCEPPVLHWAASVAKTIGWGPLRGRIVSWSAARAVPWRADVDRVIGALGADEAELLVTLAACDAPFAWDVLEAVVPDISVDAIVRLEEARVLRRNVSAGVVTFLVPYAVRAVFRARGIADEGRWLSAWTQRASELGRTSYGPSSRATLTELAAAIPLASRGLFDPAREQGALSLWNAAADAMFFADAIAFDAPAFSRAVEVADRSSDTELRVRARIVAGRAALERGDPASAASLTADALSLADRDELRVEALRGAGWAAVALTKLDDARAFFERARTLAEGEPRGQADATAGLGILALLGGDADAARALLSEAVAIHVVMRDAPREAAVRGMMELLPEGMVDTSGLAASAHELRTKGLRWREALSLARLALDARARGDSETERARLAEARAAAMLSNMPASKLVRSLVERAASPSAIVVTQDARSLTLPTGETHELARHGPVRRILWTLAVARRDRPGVPMSTLDMIEAGWPGEKMLHEAGTLRVYTTVRRLRALGLDHALMTRDDGYLLDPDVALTIA